MNDLWKNFKRKGRCGKVKLEFSVFQIQQKFSIFQSGITRQNRNPLNFQDLNSILHFGLLSNDVHDHFIEI